MLLLTFLDQTNDDGVITILTENSGKFRPNTFVFPFSVCEYKDSHVYNYVYNWGTLLVAQLVKALRYKSEGRGFNSRWCHWIFSLTHSFRPQYGSGVDSASNRNEYQEYFPGGKGGRCVGLTTLSPSCADCLEMWEPQPPGALRACPGL
jgi:hypothetical protein